MKRRQDGYVLVTVLWVVALLTVVTMSYHHRARLEVQSARYSLDSAQCRMAARGAVQRGILTLRNKQVTDFLANPAAGWEGPPCTHLGQGWARRLDLYTNDALLDPGENFENDVASVMIVDLERYININTAPDDLLEDLPGLTFPVIRRINARRDGTDDTGKRNEEGPVRFHDPAELRYFRGIDNEDWFGDDDEPGLRDLLTTFGDGRININTVSFDVLRRIPDVGDSAAESVLAYRNGGDGTPGTADDRGFTAWDTFADVTQIGGDALVALKQRCKFDSDYFRITGTATRRGGRIRASCSAVVHLPNGSDTATVVSWTEDSLGS